MHILLRRILRKGLLRCGARLFLKLITAASLAAGASVSGSAAAAAACCRVLFAIGVDVKAEVTSTSCIAVICCYS